METFRKGKRDTCRLRVIRERLDYCGDTRGYPILCRTESCTIRCRRVKIIEINSIINGVDRA